MAYTPVGAVSTHHYVDDIDPPDEILPVNGFGVRGDVDDYEFDLAIEAFKGAGAKLLYRWNVPGTPSPHQSILRWPGDVVTVAFGGENAPKSFEAGYGSLASESAPITRIYRDIEQGVAFAKALKRAVNATYTVSTHPLSDLAVKNKRGSYQLISVRSTIGNYDLVSVPEQSKAWLSKDILSLQSTYGVNDLPATLKRALANKAIVKARYYSSVKMAPAAVVKLPGGYVVEVVQKQNPK